MPEHLDKQSADCDLRPRFDLMPWRPLEEVARVLAFSTRKYAPGSWRHLPMWRVRFFAAAVRHLVRWFLGATRDPESGCSALAHALCSVMFMLDIELIDQRALHPDCAASPGTAHAVTLTDLGAEPLRSLPRPDGWELRCLLTGRSSSLLRVQAGPSPADVYAGWQMMVDQVRQVVGSEDEPTQRIARTIAQ